MVFSVIIRPKMIRRLNFHRRWLCGAISGGSTHPRRCLCPSSWPFFFRSRRLACLRNFISAVIVKILLRQLHFWLWILRCCWIVSRIFGDSQGFFGIQGLYCFFPVVFLCRKLQLFLVIGIWYNHSDRVLSNLKDSSSDSLGFFKSYVLDYWEIPAHRRKKLSCIYLLHYHVERKTMSAFGILQILWMLF